MTVLVLHQEGRSRADCNTRRRLLHQLRKRQQVSSGAPPLPKTLHHHHHHHHHHQKLEDWRGNISAGQKNRKFEEHDSPTTEETGAGEEFGVKSPEQCTSTIFFLLLTSQSAANLSILKTLLPLCSSPDSSFGVVTLREISKKFLSFQSESFAKSRPCPTWQGKARLSTWFQLSLNALTPPLLFTLSRSAI